MDLGTLTFLEYSFIPINKGRNSTEINESCVQARWFYYQDIREVGDIGKSSFPATQTQE